MANEKKPPDGPKSNDQDYNIHGKFSKAVEPVAKVNVAGAGTSSGYLSCLYNGAFGPPLTKDEENKQKEEETKKKKAEEKRKKKEENDKKRLEDSNKEEKKNLKSSAGSSGGYLSILYNGACGPPKTKDQEKKEREEYNKRLKEKEKDKKEEESKKKEEENKKRAEIEKMKKDDENKKKPIKKQSDPVTAAASTKAVERGIHDINSQHDHQEDFSRISENPSNVISTPIFSPSIEAYSIQHRNIHCIYSGPNHNIEDTEQGTMYARSRPLNAPPEVEYFKTDVKAPADKKKPPEVPNDNDRYGVNKTYSEPDYDTENDSERENPYKRSKPLDAPSRGRESDDNKNKPSVKLNDNDRYWVHRLYSEPDYDTAIESGAGTSFGYLSSLYVNTFGPLTKENEINKKKEEASKKKEEENKKNVHNSSTGTSSYVPAAGLLSGGVLSSLYNSAFGKPKSKQEEKKIKEEETRKKRAEENKKREEENRKRKEEEKKKQSDSTATTSSSNRACPLRLPCCKETPKPTQDGLGTSVKKWVKLISIPIAALLLLLMTYHTLSIIYEYLSTTDFGIRRHLQSINMSSLFGTGAGVTPRFEKSPPPLPPVRETPESTGIFGIFRNRESGRCADGPEKKQSCFEHSDSDKNIKHTSADQRRAVIMRMFSYREPGTSGSAESAVDKRPAGLFGKFRSKHASDDKQSAEPSSTDKQSSAIKKALELFKKHDIKEPDSKK